MLEKPYENKDLLGITRKYLNDKFVCQRKHRRFDTKQKALLESYNKDYAAYTTVFNISKGGAYIQGDLADMSKGDLLRVNLNLEQVKKSHSMSAQVVWTSGEVGSKDRAAGIQFVSKEKLYRDLMGSI